MNICIYSPYMCLWYIYMYVVSLFTYIYLCFIYIYLFVLCFLLSYNIFIWLSYMRYHTSFNNVMHLHNKFRHCRRTVLIVEECVWWLHWVGEDPESQKCQFCKHTDKMLPGFDGFRVAQGCGVGRLKINHSCLRNKMSWLLISNSFPSLVKVRIILIRTVLWSNF